VQNTLRSHLLKAGRPAYVEEDYVSVADARRLVLELGGIPCYPVLADGVEPVTEFEADAATLIENLQRLGLWCVEFIPLRNSAPTLLRTMRALHEAGFVVTAGTEHNTIERPAMAPM